jgi:uncharacterized membrane protein
MAKIGFNANQVEPSTPMDVLPAGKYLCMAIASELKPTKNGAGEYLQITFEVLDGTHKGRKIFERLNIRNSNKTAEDIAQRALSALCHAVSVIELDDSDQLHNIPVTLDVAIDPAKGEYSASNKVKGYVAAGGSPVHRQAMVQAAAERAAPAPAATSGAPVWKRKAA